MEKSIIKCKAKLYETYELLSNEFCINYTAVERRTTKKRLARSRETNRKKAKNK